MSSEPKGKNDVSDLFASIIEEKDVLYRFYNLTKCCSEEDKWETPPSHIVNLFWTAFYYVLDNYGLAKELRVEHMSSSQKRKLIKCFIRAYFNVMREKHFFDCDSSVWEGVRDSCISRFNDEFNSHKNKKAGVLIMNNDLSKVLLVQSRIGPGVKYSIPKGNIEADEDPISAAIRESYEETQLYLGHFLLDPYCYYPSDLKAILPMKAWRPAAVGKYDFLSGHVPLIRTAPVKKCFDGYHLYFAPGVPDALLKRSKPLSAYEIAKHRIIPKEKFCDRNWAEKNLLSLQASNVDSLREIIEILTQKQRKLLPLQKMDGPEISDWMLVSLMWNLFK